MKSLADKDWILGPCDHEERRKRRRQAMRDKIDVEYVEPLFAVHTVYRTAYVSCKELVVVREDLGVEFPIARLVFSGDYDGVLGYVRTLMNRSKTKVSLEQFDLWLHEIRKRFRRKLMFTSQLPVRDVDPTSPIPRRDYPDQWLSEYDAKRIGAKLDRKLLSSLSLSQRVMLSHHAEEEAWAEATS